MNLIIVFTEYVENVSSTSNINPYGAQRLNSIRPDPHNAVALSSSTFFDFALFPYLSIVTVTMGKPKRLRYRSDRWSNFGILNLDWMPLLTNAVQETTRRQNIDQQLHSMERRRAPMKSSTPYHLRKFHVQSWATRTGKQQTFCQTDCIVLLLRTRLPECRNRPSLYTR